MQTVEVIESGRPTSTLSSRGGSVGCELQKAYMPPRSAAADGSAGFVVVAST